MTLDQRARKAGADLRDQLAALDPPRPGVTARRSRRGRLVTGAAAVALLALVVGAVILLRLDQRDEAPITPSPVVLPPNGWVAFSTVEGVGGLEDSDVYLVREGDRPRRIAGTATDSSVQDCPAFSPDGERLAFGQATVTWNSGNQSYESDAELVLMEVDADGAISDSTTIPLDGLRAQPCGLVWSPDSRWLAFRTEGEVWLVDTVTQEQRRLGGRAATDLEWLPGTDELAIADEGIDIYSVTTGEVRSLGLDDVHFFTWSPDGTQVAFTREPSGGETNSDNSSLWLADADGTDQRRLLPYDYLALQGTGPVWSPDGRSVAFNRSTGLSEKSEVLVVDLADADDPTELIIPYPTTPGPSGPVVWNNPRHVTWSPDGSTLLYVVWNDACNDRQSANCAAQAQSAFAGLLAVPVDMAEAPFVLADPSWMLGDASWGRQSAG